MVKPDFPPNMTLRDYFATAALMGMLAHYAFHDYTEYEHCALKAYGFADAMLQVREL